MDNHMHVHSAPCAQYKIWRIISAKIHKGILKDDFQAYEVSCKTYQVGCESYVVDSFSTP